MDPNAEKFDAGIIMRSITCGDYDAVVDNAVVPCGENNAVALMRKKAYGEMYADKFMR